MSVFLCSVERRFAGRAYWLIDEIIFAQRLVPEVAGETFQLWRLTLEDDRSAILSCMGSNGETVWTREIGWTDFPLATITFYYTDRTLLLSSEY